MSGPKEIDGPKAGGTDFWSRRKSAVRAAEEAEQAEREAEALAVEHARLEQKPESEILEELGLPDPDTLNEQDDFSRFLETAVPEGLRRRALRRLWTLNPVLANLDGLVDYADDFTDAATVIPNMQTVYQVGKGMFDKVAAAAEAEEKARLAQAAREDLAQQEALTAQDRLAEGTASLSDDGEDAEQGEGALQREEIAAMHNDCLQNGKTSFQLTQGVAVVQSESGDMDSDDLQETESENMLEHPEVIRRRMKFDYS